MEELQSAETTAFLAESEIEPLVVKVIRSHMKDMMYEESLMTTLINYICEDIMQGLAELGKPFKYVGESHRTASVAQAHACVFATPVTPYRPSLPLFCLHCTLPRL